MGLAGCANGYTAIARQQCVDGRNSDIMQDPTSGAERAHFGTLPDGRVVEVVTLTNAAGLRARIITLGATLQALFVPDGDGRPDDVVLGYDSAAEYLDQTEYLGVTAGRYANRIAEGRFTLDGQEYRLDCNNGPNHLHGGSDGFGRRLWTIEAVEGGATPSVTMRLMSPDGDGGYPGALEVHATYTLSASDELSIDYRATADRPTIVNITNHSYFNLGGAAVPASILNHRLTLHAGAFTPVDDTLIPTGELRPVAGTAFDFRQAKAIGADIRDAEEAQLRIGQGYDHNFAIDGRAGELRPAARLEDGASGRVMDLLVSAPGVQFYSGNVLSGALRGKLGRLYRQSDGLCLEPQTFPDAPNRPAFPQARLEPGEVYLNMMRLRFSTV